MRESYVQQDEDIAKLCTATTYLHVSTALIPYHDAQVSADSLCMQVVFTYLDVPYAYLTDSVACLQNSTAWFDMTALAF